MLTANNEIHGLRYYFGATEQFTGFGILFDTFRNSESGHVHKDVSVVVNNGDSERHEVEGERPGCMSAFRKPPSPAPATNAHTTHALAPTLALVGQNAREQQVTRPCLERAD